MEPQTDDHDQGADEGADAPANAGSEWDLQPGSGEGSATALSRWKRLEKARAVLRGRQSPRREPTDREGPSRS